MSLLIDELAAYLESQGEGVVGTDIFKLHRPSSPVSCLSLHATGGYPPDRYVPREHPTVMVFARGATPAEALSRAYSAFAVLHQRQGVALGEHLRALTIEALGSPAYVGTEQAGGQTAHLASFNVAIDLRGPTPRVVSGADSGAISEESERA